MNDLLQAAKEAQKNAYTPYYNFPVGAAILAETGRIYKGCNVENAAASAHNGCAESNAIANAVVAGDRHFKSVAVVGPTEEFLYPCGTCRQKLYEFSPDMTVILINKSGQTKTHTLKEIFPYATLNLKEPT